MKTEFETLLKPIAEDAPAGKWLRGTPTYRKIEAALQEDLSGAAHGGVLIRARPEECAALAMEALSTETKDLVIAVWLAEALVRIDGFDGLRRGIDFIRELLVRYWETVYPLPDDGDEGIRGAPLARLTGKAFSLAMEQIAITKDGYTRLDEQISKTIPLPEDIGSDAEMARVRRDAEEKKRILPEKFATSLRATDFHFYERLSKDIAAAREAVRNLEAECDSRFSDPDAAPGFKQLTALFEPYEELATEMMRQKAPVSSPASVSAAVEPAPPQVEEATPPSLETASPESGFPPAIGLQASLVSSELLTSEPTSEEDAAQRVFAAARYLRRQNPANPAGFLLTRWWRFGPVIGRGSVTDEELEPPPADLRKELWQLHKSQDWNGLLERAEEAMELRCAAAWLDLHFYAGTALENLGETYEAARKATSGVVHHYVSLLPGLARSQLLDGTPAVSPATGRWLESLGTAEEISDQSRPETSPIPDPPTPHECFEDSLRLAKSGRIAEALKDFYQSRQAEDTGRARFEGRLRVASLFMAGKQHALALPGLRELRRGVDEWRLDQWEPELAGRALIMLHQCLVASSASADEIAEVFGRICIIDPLLAIRVGDRR